MKKTKIGGAFCNLNKASSPQKFEYENAELHRQNLILTSKLNKARCEVLKEVESYRYCPHCGKPLIGKSFDHYCDECKDSISIPMDIDLSGLGRLGSE